MQKGGYMAANEMRSKIKPVGLWLLCLLMWHTGEVEFVFTTAVSDDPNDD